MEIIEITPTNLKALEVKRVAAYARVSSDKEAAEHSLSSQATIYEDMIKRRLDWKLVKVYIDEGITGTKDSRPAFQEMLKDCENGKIDLILTKSITRFARNTVTLLETTRRLKALGVDVYFEKEQMHSLSPDGEMMLTLLAMYAEEESRSVSENQKWKIRKRFEKGIPTFFRIYGYRMINARLEIVPEEAEVVRRIFDMYLSGIGSCAIARQLNRESITLRGSLWVPATIRRMVKNEKYIGDLMLQKRYTPDFRNKRQKRNQGQVRRYYVTGSHEPIISKEDYEKAQAVIEHKNSERVFQPVTERIHLYRGLLTCDICGKHYLFKNKRQKYLNRSTPIWICYSYLNFGKNRCNSDQIPEGILNAVTRKVLDLPKETPLTRELLLSRIEQITSLPGHIICFYLKNGITKTLHWEHTSRRYSWTPEMRQKAREKALKQWALKRKGA